MRITTIGRGSIGGTLARLWTAAGHQVTALGRDGGEASDADVVLLAVRHADIPAALAGVTGLDGKTVIESSNRLDGELPHDGHASNAEYVKAALGGPTAEAFNLNFGKLLEGASQAPNRPDNIWVGDETARDAVEQLTRDAGDATAPRRTAGPRRHAGGLRRALRGDRQGRRFRPALLPLRDAGSDLTARILWRGATPSELPDGSSPGAEGSSRPARSRYPEFRDPVCAAAAPAVASGHDGMSRLRDHGPRAHARHCARGRGASLPGHCDAHAFLGVDEVVVIVAAEVDLHPVDLSGEPAALGGVVG